MQAWDRLRTATDPTLTLDRPKPSNSYRSSLGRVDQGHMRTGNFGDEDWARMLDLNLTAPFRLLRRALPGMVDQGVELLQEVFAQRQARIEGVIVDLVRIGEPRHQVRGAADDLGQRRGDRGRHGEHLVGDEVRSRRHDGLCS